MATTEVPLCRNFKEGRECSRSDMRMVEDNDECWIFVCKSCSLVSAVAKDGVSNKNKYDLLQKRMAQQAELVKRWERRKKIFAVRG